MQDYSILCIDDELLLLGLSKIFLEKNEDFNVDISPSATDAMEKLNNRHYDAIIADYQMPDMNGIEFLKEVPDQIRGHAIYPVYRERQGRGCHRSDQ
jgi:DNA-binding response OmpR family regulator